MACALIIKKGDAMYQRAVWFLVLIVAWGVVSAHAQDISNREIPIMGEMAGVRLSPDGQMIVTFENGVIHNDYIVPEFMPIRLYDVATGEEVAAFTGHTDYASSAVFSADNRTLVTYHNHGYIYLWDVKSREFIRRIPALPGYLQMDLFPDGQTLAVLTGGIGQVSLFDVGTGHITQVLMRRFDTYAEFREREMSQGPLDNFVALAIAPDGQSLATATIFGRIYLWDIQTGDYHLLRDADSSPALNIRQLRFTPDGSSLVFSHREDAMIYGLDVASGRETFGVPADGIWFAVSHDGTRVAWFGESRVYMADVSRPDESVELAFALPAGLRPQAPQLLLAFLPGDNQLVLGGFYAPDGGNRVFIIDVPESG